MFVTKSHIIWLIWQWSKTLYEKCEKLIAGSIQTLKKLKIQIWIPRKFLNIFKEINK